MWLSCEWWGTPLSRPLTKTGEKIKTTNKKSSELWGGRLSHPQHHYSLRSIKTTSAPILHPSLFLYHSLSVSCSQQRAWPAGKWLWAERADCTSANCSQGWVSEYLVEQKIRQHSQEHCSTYADRKQTCAVNHIVLWRLQRICKLRLHSKLKKRSYWSNWSTAKTFFWHKKGHVSRPLKNKSKRQINPLAYIYPLFYNPDKIEHQHFL